MDAPLSLAGSTEVSMNFHSITTNPCVTLDDPEISYDYRYKSVNPSYPPTAVNRHKSAELHADIIDQALAADILEVRSLLIVSECGTDALRHRHNDGAITHVEPKATAHELVVGIAGKRTVGISAEVRLEEGITHGLIFPGQCRPFNASR